MKSALDVIRRRGRVGLTVALVAGLVVLCARPGAVAGDVFANVGPASQLPSGSLMDAYPVGNYALDHNFSAVDAGVFSGVDVSGIAPTIAWFLASVIWLLTAFLAYATITLFTFAFSLDLIGGTGTAGGAGALAPVAEAVRSIYRSVFGGPWLVLAITLTGLWALWHALVRRRYTETAGALGLSLVFVVIALAFVTQPERTIGEASRWTNAISGAFLSVSAEGNVTSHAEAKRRAADQLFELLVFEPWVVLQFGGREHCARANGGDDPASARVRPLSRSPDRDAELSRRLSRQGQIEADGKTCVNAANKYAPRFLKYPSGSDERDQHYQALRDGDTGKAPDQDRDGYRLGPVDKPAADAMGKDGQYQRLLLAIVVLGGEIGPFLLIGALAVAVILAQVLVLVLVAFAPVALVIGVVPGRGHDFFRSWLGRLAAFLLRKAVYSLILAVLLAVTAAVADASSNLGWLMSWGLQTAFFWTVFLWRKQLLGQITHAATGHRPDSGSGAAQLAFAYGLARTTRRVLHRPRRPGHGGTRPPARAASAAPDPDPGPSAERPPPPADAAAPSADAAAAGGDPNAPPQSARAGETARTGHPNADTALAPPAAGGSDPPSSSHDAPPAGEPRAANKAPDRKSPLRRGLRDDEQRLRRGRAADDRPRDPDGEPAPAPPSPTPLPGDEPSDLPRPRQPTSDELPAADREQPAPPSRRRGEARGERQ